MLKSVFMFLLSVTLVLFISQTFGAAKGGYVKEVTGSVWTESVGSDVIEYTFTKNKYISKLPTMSIEFNVVKIDDAKKRIILSVNKKFVPMWWEIIDSNTLSVTQLENSLYCNTLTEALKKGKPSATSKLTKKK